ncbi:hypothetical protein DPMN_073949 [Dreissena polymorpha]|uniref:Uncharacterized protein n=1 Tax=Dreissena polymorpha TaxID=45954 RepID=A0A9D4BL43_DREPO|nr:hypothetical protein DPMN_073949 [Dreissena polymorpha]
MACRPPYPSKSASCVKYSCMSSSTSMDERFVSSARNVRRSGTSSVTRVGN